MITNDNENDRKEGVKLKKRKLIFIFVLLQGIFRFVMSVLLCKSLF